MLGNVTLRAILSTAKMGKKSLTSCTISEVNLQFYTVGLLKTLQPAFFYCLRADVFCVTETTIGDCGLQHLVIAGG